MIWGLTLEPGKQYTRVMGGEVQLSMATLESRDEFGSTSDVYSHVVLRTPRNEYLLCTLVHGTTFQQSLDLKLRPTETVTFSVQGTSIVYLTGYSVEDTEVEDQIEVEFDEVDPLENAIGVESGGYGTAENTDTGMSEDPVHQQQDATASVEEEEDRKPIIKQEPQDPVGTMPALPGFPQSSFPIKQEGGDEDDVTEISEDDWDQSEEMSRHIQVSLGQDQGPQAPDDSQLGPLGQPQLPGEQYQSQNSGHPQLMMMARNTMPQGQPPSWPGGVPPSPATLIHQRGAPHPQSAGPGGGAVRGRPPANQLTGPSSQGRGTLGGGGPVMMRSNSYPQEGISPGSSRPHPPKEKANGGRKQGQGISCECCGMVATNATQLKVHMKSHTGERTYNCSVCGKVLSNFNSKVRHERSHLGVRPFPCRYCPKTFTQPHHRKRHEASHGAAS